MNFFSQCKTKEEVKVVYRRLAKAFHPDKGGEAALMMELQKQFDEWQPDSGFTQRFNYSFNRINIDNIIPFDHPIHNQIRKLQSETLGLKIEISTLRDIQERDQSILQTLCKEKIALQMLVKVRDDEIIRLCKALEASKKAPLPLLWHYIKQRFNTWYYNEK